MWQHRAKRKFLNFVLLKPKKKREFRVSCGNITARSLLNE